MDPGQLNLAIEDIKQALAVGDAKTEKANLEVKRPRSAERRKSQVALPPHLPRIKIIITPEATACPCCRGAMHVIGEHRSERLDIIPLRYQVIATPAEAKAAGNTTASQRAATAAVVYSTGSTSRLVTKTNR